MLSALRARWVRTWPTVQPGRRLGRRRSMAVAELVEHRQQPAVRRGGAGQVARQPFWHNGLVHGRTLRARLGRHAARDDRPRTDGRQHGPPVGARRTRVRRLRHRPDGGRGPRRRGHDGRGARSSTSSPRSTPPRHVWIMVPAAFVDSTIAASGAAARPRRHDHRRRQLLVPRRHRPGQPLAADHGIDYVDVGTSGGTHGLERGYCLMIGGPDQAVERLAPIFDDAGARRRRRGADAGAERCSASRPRRPSGAGCTAVRTAPGTSSRWSTTASSTA